MVMLKDAEAAAGSDKTPTEAFRRSTTGVMTIRRTRGG
jgi:hypothetical protein